MIDKVQAILSLVPDAEIVVVDNDVVEWHNPSVAPVTEQQIQDEMDRLENLYVSNEYQRERFKEYPSIGEQLDMLWHAIDAGKLNKTSDFYTTLKSVKDKYPKSE